MNKDELQVIIANAVNKFLDKNSGNYFDDLDIQDNINIEIDEIDGPVRSNELSIEVKYYKNK